MDCYYKLWHLFYYKERHGLLQITTGITKCDGFITNCDSTNVTLKPELEPTVIACLEGSKCSRRLVYWICPNTERRFEAILVIYNADIHRQEHRLQLLDGF